MKERGLRSSWVPGGCWGAHVTTTKEAPGGSVRRTAVRGIDLHRRIVRMTAAGAVLEATRIVNGADRLAAVLCRAGESPEVVLEATYGWYWAADVLAAGGARVCLAP
jgi:hypothetical protein